MKQAKNISVNIIILLKKGEQTRVQKSSFPLFDLLRTIIHPLSC
jgi:hypothetical protein